MKPFSRVRSSVIPMLQPDINTDEIIPARFMSRPRVDYGRYFFHDSRFFADGAPRPGFVLNDARHAEAQILLAGANFGCGSSREHAVFALADYGIRVVMAPQFADIFHANCFKSGVLPIELPSDFARELTEHLRADAQLVLDVDLASQTVNLPGGNSRSFSIDPFRKRNLLEGLDEIDRTLEFLSDIERFESRGTTLSESYTTR